MRRFRAIAAILLLVLTMPLAHASAVISSAVMSQQDCCKQKADLCCEGPSKACCVTQAPADTSLFPSQSVSQLLLASTAAPVVRSDRFNSLIVLCTARRVPAEHLPPGLMIVATTVLRI